MRASLRLTWPQYTELLEHTTPHWHACVFGPPPYGRLEPAKLTFNYIIAGGREGAEDAVRRQLERLCEAWGREFDEDEWTLAHLVIVNGN